MCLLLDDFSDELNLIKKLFHESVIKSILADQVSKLGSIMSLIGQLISQELFSDQIIIPVS